MDSDRRINLWVVQSRFLPDWAGPAVRFLGYAPGLQKRGIDLTFVTANRPGLPAQETQNSAQILRIGPTRVSVASYLDFNPIAIGEATRQSKQLRPDVILFLDANPGDIPYLWLLRLKGIGSLFVNTMAWGDDQNRGWRRFFSHLLRGLLFSSFQKLVFSSQEIIASFPADLHIPSGKFEIIPNGVNTERFSPPASKQEIRDLRQALDLPQNELIFLYVGAMVDRKGVLELIEAWKLYRRAGGPGWLVMVGQEPRDRPEFNSFFQKWDQMIASLEDSDQVQIRPPHTKIEEYLKTADAFVFLSRIEGMSNILLEAMSSGMAVLTTKFTGFSDLYGRDGNEFITTSHQTVEISEKLAQLAENSPLRASLGQNARKWIIQTLGLDASLDSYARLIGKLTGRH